MATQSQYEASGLRLLVDAGIALSSERSLDALLQRIVQNAAELTGARYAALGVIDPSGKRLERFLTTGIDDVTRAAIGHEPVGLGILGALIRDARPLRLDRISDDPRSVGFPRNHPPMTAFLGVPIVLRGSVYGNLYLTDKIDGDAFTDEDEDLTQLLAVQAAVAIENARLHERSARWLRHLESLNEIGSALASQVELEPLLAMIAARLRELVRARAVIVALPDAPGMLRVVAADGEQADAVLGMHLALEGSKLGAVLARGRSERVDALIDDPEVNLALVEGLRVATALYVPLEVDGEAIGVVAAYDRMGNDRRFSSEDLQLAESLAKRAAIGIDLSRRVSRDAVHRVIQAQEVERSRLARELHDETGQALTSILLALKSLEQAVATDEARAAINDVRELAVRTLQDVRRLAVELRPAALDDFGLGPALERLVDLHRRDHDIAIDLETVLADTRFPADVETTMYRVVQESLTNIAKHAGAKSISVLVARRDNAAVVVVEDDGGGFDPDVRAGGIGLVGMRERVALVGGRLRIETARGAGTTIAVEIPLR